jgi:LEA14-like dessication related protein
VNVADLRMGTAGIFEQQFFVKLRVQNPGERELVLKGVSFDLDLNDKAFAKGSGATDVVVPPFGTALVEVETVSTLPGMLRQLSGMTSAGKAPVAMNYRMRGRLHAAGRLAAIPFEEKGEWNLGESGSGGTK